MIGFSRPQTGNGIPNVAHNWSSHLVSIWSRISSPYGYPSEGIMYAFLDYLGKRCVKSQNRSKGHWIYREDSAAKA